jgi:hypothetical protein
VIVDPDLEMPVGADLSEGREGHYRGGEDADKEGRYFPAGAPDRYVHAGNGMLDIEALLVEIARATSCGCS